MDFVRSCSDMSMGSKEILLLIMQYIQKMVPYVNQGMIERLTYLQTGHGLVFGTAINLPTLTRFPEASPKPDSENAKISEKWYIK